MTFIDSNVFIYAIDSTSTPKQKEARRIVAEALAPHAPFCISAQVLAEFASVSIRKLKMSVPLILEFISEMGRISRVVVDNSLVARAVEIQGLYGIQFYDAQVVAAAERLKCDIILTEDLNDGQLYCGATAVNPFKRHSN